MKTFTYPAFVFRQRENSPQQIAFVAPAGELLEWTGVPRKSDELLTGYQRFRDDKRVDEEIVPFFQNPKNCSPTAIIVALRRDSALGTCTVQSTEADHRGVSPATVTITLDEQKAETDEVFVAASDYISARLARSAPEPAPEDEDEEEEEEEDTEFEDGDEVSGDGGDGISLHLGTETLKRMKDLLEDRQNWSNPDFRTAIRDYVKPAFLIDGQHRTAAGAKFGNWGLPFMVCGLLDAPWEEQVFHFTVVNLKPKKIPPALITSIAALSLTKSEQDAVRARLSNAGVKMDEVAIMSLVAYDARSPFCDWVDMAVGSPKTKEARLGYGSMKRIAKIWYAAKRTSLTQIAKQTFNTNSMREARVRWRETNAWFYFFSAFWDAVRQHYPEDLWRKSPGNHLFIGAHLWALQEVILSAADAQLPSVWHVDENIEDVDQRKAALLDKLLELVRVNITYFPKELWTHQWAKASQDTTAGRDDLVTLFEKFVDNGKKSGGWKAWKSDEWFSV